MEERILKVLENINEELLTYTGDDMLKDGIVNSFTFIALVGDLEDEFDIEIDEEFLEKEYFGNKDRIFSTIKSLLEE